MKRPITLALGAALTVAGVAFFGAKAEAAPVACTVKLSSYTAPGSFDSLPGVNQAIVAINNAGGGTICVDGMFNIRNFIDLDRVTNRNHSIAFVGTSMTGSGFTATANSPIFFQGDQTLRPEANGNTSSPYRGQYRYNTVFSNMKLVKPANTIGRVFDFRTGAQVNMTMTNLDIDTYASGSNGTANQAIYVGPHHQGHGNLFQNLRINMRPNNPSSALRVEFTHNFWNNNKLNVITAYKHNNNGSPLFEVRPVSAGWTVNANSFSSITGQNGAGGLIHIIGQNGGGIYDSQDWDLERGTQYRDSICLGRVNNFTLSGLGDVERPYGAGALMSGRHLIAVGSGSSGVSVLGTVAPTYTGLNYG